MSRRRGHQHTNGPREWQPLRPAIAADPAFFLVSEGPNARMFKNDRYTVIIRPVHETIGDDGWVHISIRRNDRSAVRDWRHMQRIKNELCGREREAVELYPAESRLVDESNQFHLWVGPVGFEFPMGFKMGRSVTGAELAESVGAKQRELDDDVASTGERLTS